MIFSGGNDGYHLVSLLSLGRNLIRIKSQQIVMEVKTLVAIAFAYFALICNMSLKCVFP